MDFHRVCLNPVTRTALGALVFSSLLAPSDGYALTLSNVFLGSDGTCSAADPKTQFRYQLSWVASDFPTDDGGGTDRVGVYLVDGGGTIVGAFANQVVVGSEQSGLSSGVFVDIAPTSAGDFTIYWIDEFDATLDQSVGATFVATNVLDSVAFDAIALDPDCTVGPPPDTTPPEIASIERLTSTGDTTFNTQNVNADTLQWRVTFNEDMGTIGANAFGASNTTATVTFTQESATTYIVTASGGDLADLDAVVQLTFVTNLIEDASGNALVTTTSSGADERVYFVDNTSPTVQFSSSASEPVSGPFTVVATFSEVMNNPSVNYSVTGGTLNGYNIGGPVSNIFVIPTVEGIVSVAIAGTPTDAAGNPLLPSTPFEIRYEEPDTQPPVLTSVGLESPNFFGTTNSDTLTFQVTWNEPVENVSVDDFQLVGVPATVSSITGFGQFRVVTFSGPNLVNFNGDVSFGFTPGQDIADASGNVFVPATPTGVDQSNVTLDNIQPTVVSIEAASSSPTNSDSGQFIVRFSEEVLNVTADDFVVTGSTATVSALTQFGSRAAYRVTVSGGNLATLNGSVGLSFAAVTEIRDDGLNLLTNVTPSGVNESIVFDNAGPSVLSVTRQSPSDEITSADEVTFRVTFDEALGSVNFSSGVGVSVSGTTATTSFTQVSSSVFDIRLSGGDLATTNGTVGIGVLSNPGTLDVAGNPLANTTPGTNETYTLDNQGGTYTLQSDGFISGNTIFESVFSLSEDTDGVPFNAAAVDLAGATNVSGYSVNLTNGTLTLRITPSGPGPFSLAIGSGLYADAAGNPFQALGTISGNLDGIAPAVASVERFSPANENTADDTLVWRVTFSENVQNADATDFVLSGSTAGVSVSQLSGSLYQITASGGDLANFNGVIAVAFTGSQDIQDVAGNALVNTTPTGANESYNVDNGLPSVVINGAPTQVNTVDPFIVTVEFSEEVTGFEQGDVTVANGSVTNFQGSGDTYSVEITPDGNGGVSIDIANDVAQDSAGNGNTAATQVVVAVDSVAPTLVISGVPESFAMGDVFNVTFDFGEAVTGFDASDVTITGGTGGALTGGPQTYAMTVTPDGTDNLTILVAAGAAQDDFGNLSSEASASSTIDSASVAGEMIAEFMQNRARNLVRNQPRLTDFLTGRQSGQFNFDATGEAAKLNAHSGSKGPLWFALQGSRTDFEASPGDSTYLLATIGTHSRVNEGLLVGGMLQFDYANDDLGGGIGTDGHGWLAGPYFIAQLGTQPLYFEGRALYGRSSNTISPFGTFADEFDSERWLAMLALEGSYEGETVRYFPRLQLSHVSDQQEAYVDSLSNSVAEQEIRLMEVAAGVDFEKPLLLGNGDHLLTWGISGIYSRLSGDGAASTFITETEGSRARVDLGYLYDNRDGMTVSADIFVDGLGSGDFISYGVSLGMSVDF
ncbi:Ig-like domain-containing protein [Aestuariivita boseongensis]|uniref:Ig-like domain-containing protein n=1 Tax=Aestuariivita boseongensis TaxID=1470562 RepID=UPI000AE7A5DF|nr:Ig-like domain-containing protein [Aestuariivita boseongensis]